METKETEGEMVKITESELLSLVADRLKDRILFPEKVKEAKQFIKSITSSVL